MTVKSSVDSSLKSFQLKGSMVTVMVMEILQSDLSDLSFQLQEKVSAAPDFFQDTPLVLSLEKISEDEEIDFVSLVDMCRINGLFPFAIKSGGTDQLNAARKAGLLPISGAKTRAAPLEQTSDKEKTEGASADESSGEGRQVEIIPPSTLSPAKEPTKMVTRPIRSGQQVYAKGGDLIVLSSVSEGAEILADGNIHVYGVLRGRALAGVHGDKSARIFCSNLDASLISVAGVYLLNDNIDASLVGKPVQIVLDNEQLEINEL